MGWWWLDITKLMLILTEIKVVVEVIWMGGGEIRPNWEFSSNFFRIFILMLPLNRINKTQVESVQLGKIQRFKSLSFQFPPKG